MISVILPMSIILLPPAAFPHAIKIPLTLRALYLRDPPTIQYLECGCYHCGEHGHQYCVDLC